MDDGLNGAFTVIYDGSINPQKVYYIVTGLVSGRSYRFSVTATNINGVGQTSAIAAYVSCVPPSGMGQPQIETITRTTFVLTWNLPTSDGGCPITGYAIFSDYGTGGLINVPVDYSTTAN